MKNVFYPKLAWSGIRKNGRLYIPYLLTCIGMVMMNYIITFLSASPILKKMAGGTACSYILELGSWVMLVFAAIFLFYTNSFLIHRRKKEFGLYNVLGMGKGNIARILAWETLITAGIALSAGLITGIVFSKLGELGMTRVLHGNVTYSLTVSWQSVCDIFVRFAVIFLLLFLNTLRQISFSNPVELLRSEAAGEKAPRANWVFGILGFVLLIAAYWMAVSIGDPVAALGVFFFAVLLVILATYLLFIAGSVVLCRILQKNKHYYYRSDHFVSVSSMTYRMKRNGAGLASICILITMVLVMISSTTCLYFGADDSLNSRYPQDIGVTIRFESVEEQNGNASATVRHDIDAIFTETGIHPLNPVSYRSAEFIGTVDGSTVYPDDRANYTNTIQFFLIPLADYNTLSGENVTLDEGEALISCVRTNWKSDTITLYAAENRQIAYRVRKVPSFLSNSTSAMTLVPSAFLVVNDLTPAVTPLMTVLYGGEPVVRLYWNYGVDSAEPAQTQVDAYWKIRELLPSYFDGTEDNPGFYGYSSECLADERADFYGTYGGLFFLGILLSIAFISAAVLIIYYKQISEGYEDQSRFEIMQKIGMTKKDIRRSINSQLLTVFFMPLLLAGLHLAFAFPLVRKLLILFNVTNYWLLVLTTLISFLVFALFYILVYRATANAYYHIVSGAKAEANGT